MPAQARTSCGTYDGAAVATSKEDCIPPFNVARYRKAFVAVVGATVLVLSQVFGVAATDEDAKNALQVFDGVVGLLTAFGVWRVPNDPNTNPPASR